MSAAVKALTSNSPTHKFLYYFVFPTDDGENVNFPPATRRGGQSDVRHPATTGAIKAPRWEAGKEAPVSPQFPTNLTKSIVRSYTGDRKHTLISLLS